MQSTNPVFTRSQNFTQPAPQGYPTSGYGQQPYGQPGYGPEPWAQPAPQQTAPEGVMTIDDVITKTAVTMGVLVLTAAITFMFIPQALLYPALIVSGIVGFVTVLMVSLRRKINPAFVLAYSAIEGVFIGAFSLLFAMMFDPSIVIQAVLATFVAAGATLAAYKVLRVRVTNQFRRIVTMATFAFAGLVLVNLVLSLFGINLGVRTVGGGFNAMAILISLVAVVLAVANLIMDFDYIEQGVRNRLPASESWRGAFGLTVTMVWLYTELLRILSYFRSN
ncbi:MAG: Bax inhibitor-1/YccA family protein [Propioniciclava sp.]|uniref:Bax inhibitor-1/YccA family protein n=1 Tax=Propioniciclava sp. TaxID=2038686 RepID=UPI0039E3DD96